MVTIEQIAKRAGVSKTTVSYAFSGSKKISAETREKILSIADEMNYVPNRNAQLLRRERTFKIGLFLTGFSGSYFMYLVESINTTLDLLGYRLEIHFLRGNIHEKLCDIAGSNVDAAIIHDPFESEADLERLSAIMKERNIPMVTVGTEMAASNASCVKMNGFKSFVDIVDYLFETGHRKILFLGGKSSADERQRYKGFCEGMRKHKLAIFDTWDYIGDDPCEWVGYQVIRAKFPQLTEKPDAICCANDTLAIGCIKALQSFGYTVPNDISVTGFDDLIPAKLFELNLTTMSNQVVRMGKIAAEEAVRLLKKGEKPKVIVAESELIKGETIAVRKVL